MMSFSTPTNSVPCEIQKMKSEVIHNTNEVVEKHNNKCSSPTVSLFSIITTSSFTSSSSSTTFSSGVRDVCAWCKKPNLQPYKSNALCKSVSVNNFVEGTEPMPVCCSQICFDNLRRAYFKNRRLRLNSQLLNEIPAMAVSGRLPYVCDSDKDATADGSKQACLSYYSGSDSSTNVLFTNTTNRMPSKKRHHNHQQQNNTHNRKHPMNIFHTKTNSSKETSNHDVSSNAPLYSQFNNITNKADNEILPIPLYDYIMQHVHITHFINNLMNSETMENAKNNDTNENDFKMNSKAVSPHGSNLDIVNSDMEHIDQSKFPNVEMISLFNQLVNFSNKGKISDWNKINDNGDIQVSCFNQPIIIPIPIPIFKTAPELMNILHYYGYHSLDACEKVKKTC
ncbi:unnamed protein product [Heterobilharzia americana]|nr:unnamed protein product [Heterobilharzia americana]